MGDEVVRALRLLEAGTWNDDETALVDLKEEAGRRDRNGDVLPGQTINETAARQIAGECACLANTPGGGALILGAADDGDLTGTSLDVDWLRHRVYELTERKLTIAARPVDIDGTRLLVITAPQAIEPIPWKGRITWRVGDRCVEVDRTTWHETHLLRTRFDWSGMPSRIAASAAREASVDVARRFLRDSGEEHALDLARLSTPELMRRLNLVTGDGMMTNAAVLAFVGRGEPALDYIRRDVTGGDSRQRVREGGRGLLEELAEVLTNVAAHNAVRHLRRDAVAGQIRDIPERAAREAIVNGLAHREWGLPEPTTVEHTGVSLRVTSPGGFYGGVNPTNIITHPSSSRNRALTELFAKLRLAEREGVGVDRMVGEMLRLGHDVPEIEEIDGPYVRTALVGDAADSAWLDWLSAIDPVETGEDLNSLLLLRHLVDEGWVDIRTAVPLLQLNNAETQGAVRRLGRATLDGESPLVLIPGIPDDQPPAWALSAGTRNALQERDRTANSSRAWPTRRKIARTYAQTRGRISTTELGGIVGIKATNAGSTLKELEQDGLIRASRPNRRGAGFFYAAVTDEESGSMAPAGRQS